MTNRHVKSMPLVSVVVPIYKVEQYLDICVESLVHQTYHNLEILLIDDGSPDNCPQKCDRWAATDGRIKVVHKKNGGLSDARNTGIKLAKGDYVYCIDSDDWAMPQLVEKAVETLLKQASDLVFFEYSLASEDGRKTYTSMDTPNFPDVDACDAEEALALLWQERIPNYAWSFVVSREVYMQHEIRYPLGRLMEDMATTYKIIGLASKVGFIKEELYCYRMRPGSILYKSNPKMMIDIVENVKEVDQYVNQKYNKLKVLERNWSIKYLTAVIIWAYEIRRSFDKREYNIFIKEVKYLINQNMKEIGYINLTTINKIKSVAVTTNLLVLLKIISEIRHKKP